MKLNGDRQASFAEATFDCYSQVLAAIQNERRTAIAVPELSKLIGVKTTTLNARFRRRQIAASTVGRTNFIPVDLALELAELHKYALAGWPTLEQASRLTGIRAGTIKARCEKGQLEGHVDLTKRLRINPAELQQARWRKIGEYKEAENGRREAAINMPAPRKLAMPHKKRLLPARIVHAQLPPSLDSINGFAKCLTAKSRPFIVPPAPQPEVRILTRKDYGFVELDDPPVLVQSPKTRTPDSKRTGCLWYDPEKPFSVSDCAVGQPIRYGPHDGTIVKIIRDPFCPKIQAKFPEHQHPLMREVLLIVAKTRSEEPKAAAA
ncbi:MAG TPA: hypothetical protein VG146_20315 [Verrucomicrobiae bacterium]|nr:hypothetical protein [Verrucomicrobiae bacterium]